MKFSDHYWPELIKNAPVLDEAERRVLDGEKVPSGEKVVSIFESHTDIIVKDNRETRYGHKVCLTGGRSSLVLDCVIDEGIPPIRRS